MSSDAINAGPATLDKADASAEIPGPTVSVQTGDFDIGSEIDRLTRADRDIGAVVSFTGLVREMTGAGAIQTMELEHYPGMTERALEDIADQARARWPLQGVRIVHRHGPLAPGDRIVLVLTAIAPSSGSIRGRGISDGLSENPSTVLEERERAGGRTVGGCPRGRRRRRRAVESDALIASRSGVTAMSLRSDRHGGCQAPARVRRCAPGHSANHP